MNRLIIRTSIFLLLTISVLSTSCFQSSNPKDSSGSNWLPCRTIYDCDVDDALSCSDDGYCLDKDGERITVPDHDAEIEPRSGPGQDAGDTIARVGAERTDNPLIVHDASNPEPPDSSENSGAHNIADGAIDERNIVDATDRDVDNDLDSSIIDERNIIDATDRDVDNDLDSGISNIKERWLSALDESATAWATWKTAQKDGYNYEIRNESWGTGGIDEHVGSITYVRVQDDKVVASMRSVYSFSENGDPIWEDLEDISGSTIEELYDTCRADLLDLDPNENQVSLTFDERNLLVTCTYIPHGCVDDCLFGIAIDTIYSTTPLSYGECELMGGASKSGGDLECDWDEITIGTLSDIEANPCCRERV